MVQNLKKNQITYIKSFNIYIIIVIYTLSIFYSNGFHHPDEHFQLIEFAGLKAGWNTGYDLAWEYDSQIRSSLQPYIALCIFYFFSLFNLNNPYVLAMILRGITAILSVFSISFFIRCFRPTIERRFYTVFSFLSFVLWFLPSINVRFSSEVWAGLCLLVSVGLIQLNRHTNIYFFLIGVLFGLSFEFRFQMGLCVTGLLLWLLLIKKIRFRDLFFVLGGLFTIVFLCTLLDTIYYGEFVFAPYNYFKVDLIDNVVNFYGLEPWYYYIQKIVTAPTLIIGISILFSLIYLLFYDYKNIILWCILPYLVIHSFIGHKEIRYFFPIINFAPILLIWTYQRIIYKIKKRYFQVMFHSFIFAVIIVNAGGLFMIFKPAGSGAVNLAEYIQKTYYKGNPIDIYSTYYGPYSIGNAKGWIQRFYMDDEVNLHFIDTEFLNDIPDNAIVTIPKGYFHERELLETSGYKIEHESIPTWMSFFNKLYKVYDENSVLLLYTPNPFITDYEKISYILP
ncbi:MULTISPECIES: hypothetical protein [Proteiniphilum]|uniref:hypothetical protein n=1 Tax=Proteiniphilum TaxID=294702 RepID=UPI00037AC69B|nr:MULTISPECIES: hypothetical protein [Proteiniphilum]SFL22400.1 phosphatidylinositol glycan, class B [Porphyromonadaceae bacterium KH3CP3RA]